MADIYRSDIVRVDLDHALLRKHVGAILVTGDKLGNRFGAEVCRDGKPVDVSDCGVLGYFMRPGEDTIILPGATSGSVAYVDLAQACYSKASSFTLTIKISRSGAVSALRVIDGYILLTQTDDLVDPGEAVPTLDDIFAQIAAMETATASAKGATELALAAKDNANGAAVYAVNIATEKGDQAIQLAQEEADKQNVKIATLTDDIASNTAPAIIPTATGEVVTVSDSANRPLAGLRLYGKTTQDGTPTPNSPVPLVNVGAGGSIGVKAMGKNLLNYDAWKTVIVQRGTAVWENNGVTLTATADDCYTGDGLGWEENGVEFPAKIFVTPGETISLSWEADRSYSSPVYLFPNARVDDLVSCNNTDNRPLVYTVAEGVSYVTIRFTALKAGDVISYKNIMVERGYPTTAFEPYKDGGSLTASTPNGLPGIPVTSGGNYVDEHGQQWVCDEVYFGRGVDVQRIGVYQGEVQTSSTGANANGLKFVDFYDIPYDASCVGGIMCNALPVAPTPDAGWLSTEPCLSVADGRIRLYGVEGVTYMVNIFYAMQDHIETPIPADELAAYRAMTSQKPTTTVYNDAGAGMAVDYIADTKNYIDQRIAALLNA